MSTLHNPVNFDPSAYEYLGCADNKPPQFFVDNFLLGPTQEECAAHKDALLVHEATLLRLFPAGNYHRCQHCGQSNVRWVVAAKHLATGEHVCFGSECERRLGLDSRAAFETSRLMERAAGGIGRMKVAKVFADWQQTEHGCEFMADAAKFATSENPFIVDVLGKLNTYGSLSEAQVSAVGRAYVRDLERAAQKAAEPLPTAPAPEGRVQVEGEVLCTKVQDSEFGSTLKMLVRLPTMAKVWLTVPGNIDVAKGFTIRFTATLTRSEKDQFFAFGKRPTGAVILSRPEPELVSA